MIGLYFKLLQIGHGPLDSLSRSFGHSLSSLAPFPYYGPAEVELEEKLTNLEKRARFGDMDFQSIADVENLTLDPSEKSGIGHHYRTMDELDLGRLQKVYCNHPQLLSNRQIQRYERLIVAIPEKFYELLEAIEDNDLEGYEQRKHDIYKKKREVWFEQISSNK